MAVPPCNLLIVEDDVDLRECTSEFLCAIGYAVTAVGSAVEFYQVILARPYRVALIDLGLPDQGGEILVDYVRRNTSTGVIVITARATADARITTYKLGADLFMGKPINCDELAAAIASMVDRKGNNVTFGRKVEAPNSAVKKANAWQLTTAGRKLITPDGASVDLTGNEFDFLCCLAAHHGTVDRKAILAAVNIQSGEGDQRALEALVRRIRHKVNAETQKPTPILTHYGVGYLFADQIQILGVASASVRNPAAAS